MLHYWVRWTKSLTVCATLVHGCELLQRGHKSILTSSAMCHDCWLLIQLSDFIASESIIQFDGLNIEISISTDTNSHEDPQAGFCWVTKGQCSSNIQGLQWYPGSGCTNQWTVWLRCNFWNLKGILKETLSWKMTVRGICHQYLNFPYFPCWRNKCQKSCFMKRKNNSRVAKRSLKARSSHFNPILPLPFGMTLLRANWSQTLQ